MAKKKKPVRKSAPKKRVPKKKPIPKGLSARGRRAAQLGIKTERARRKDRNGKSYVPRGARVIEFRNNVDKIEKYLITAVKTRGRKDFGATIHFVAWIGNKGSRSISPVETPDHPQRLVQQLPVRELYDAGDVTKFVRGPLERVDGLPQTLIGLLDDGFRVLDVWYQIK